MKLLKSNKGEVTFNSNISKYLYYFVGAVILVKLGTGLMPSLQSSGNEINSSGAPMGSLFASNGVIILLVMVAFLLLIIKPVQI